VLALTFGLAAAFEAGDLDPSFRTPGELAECLDLPLLATFAQNEDLQFGAGAAKGNIERTLSTKGGVLQVEEGLVQDGKWRGEQAIAYAGASEVGASPAG
jgi:hypothetical protein